MHLTRCKDQPRATLEEFYREVSAGDSYPNREGGKAMLDLIARLQALPDERTVFGLTSVQRLCLLAKDTWKSPWFVIFIAVDKHDYSIEYRMPDAVAPWPHAYVKGEAHSEDDAVRMILIGMEKSGGWAQC